MKVCFLILDQFFKNYLVDLIFILGLNVELTEINRKKDNEIADLKETLESTSSHNEMIASKLKKKHQDTINDINHQMDQVIRENTK